MAAGLVQQQEGGELEESEHRSAHQDVLGGQEKADVKARSWDQPVRHTNV